VSVRLSRHAPAPLAAALAASLGLAVGVAMWWHPAVLTIAALLLVVLTILRWPEAGVIAVIAVATLLPLGVVPLRIVFAPTFLDVAVSGTLAVVALRCALRHEPLELTRPHGLLFLFIGLAVVSLILGTAQARISAEELRLFLKLVNATLLAVSAFQIVRSEAALTRTLRALILGGTVAAVLAIGLHVLPTGVSIELLSSLGTLGYPTGPDVMRQVEGTTTLRATGTSVDPNVLGGMLMLIATLVVSQIVSPRPILPRGALAIAAISILAAVALSYSRSAWVGLVAGLGTLALFVDRRLLLAGPAAALALLTIPQGRAIIDRLLAAIRFQDQATQMRMTEYREALGLIGQHPVLGVGFGASPTVDTSVGVSSLYLLMAEHMGLLGLTVFLLIMAAVVVGSIRVTRSRDLLREAQNEREGRLFTSIHGLQAALVAALVAGAFDHYFFNMRFPHMVALFWLCVGLLVAASRITSSNTVQVNALTSNKVWRS